MPDENSTEPTLRALDRPLVSGQLVNVFGRQQQLGLPVRRVVLAGVLDFSLVGCIELPVAIV